MQRSLSLVVLMLLLPLGQVQAMESEDLLRSVAPLPEPHERSVANLAGLFLRVDQEVWLPYLLGDQPELAVLAMMEHEGWTTNSTDGFSLADAGQFDGKGGHDVAIVKFEAGRQVFEVHKEARKTVIERFEPTGPAFWFFGEDYNDDGATDLVRVGVDIFVGITPPDALVLGKWQIDIELALDLTGYDLRNDATIFEGSSDVYLHQEYASPFLSVNEPPSVSYINEQSRFEEDGVEESMEIHAEERVEHALVEVLGNGIGTEGYALDGYLSYERKEDEVVVARIADDGLLTLLGRFDLNGDDVGDWIVINEGSYDYEGLRVAVVTVTDSGQGDWDTPVLRVFDGATGDRLIEQAYTHDLMFITEASETSLFFHESKGGRVLARWFGVPGSEPEGLRLEPGYVYSRFYDVGGSRDEDFLRAAFDDEGDVLEAVSAQGELLKRYEAGPNEFLSLSPWFGREGTMQLTNGPLPAYLKVVEDPENPANLTVSAIRVDQEVTYWTVEMGERMQHVDFIPSIDDVGDLDFLVTLRDPFTENNMTGNIYSMAFYTSDGFERAWTLPFGAYETDVFVGFGARTMGHVQGSGGADEILVSFGTLHQEVSCMDSDCEVQAVEASGSRAMLVDGATGTVLLDLNDGQTGELELNVGGAKQTAVGKRIERQTPGFEALFLVAALGAALLVSRKDL